MLPLDTILTFMVVSLLLALAPGPDNLFVLTQAALYGRLSGIMVVCGLCTGLLVHTLAVVGGVALIVQASPVAFTLLKLCGAGYLLYLAWQAFRADSTTREVQPVVRRDLGRLYRRGIVMNVTNPKVSIFFLAFLPQFVAPERGAVSLQLVLLGGLFMLTTILVFGAIALLAGTFGSWLKRSERARRLLNRLAGTVLVGLSIKLLLTFR